MKSSYATDSFPKKNFDFQTFLSLPAWSTLYHMYYDVLCFSAQALLLLSTAWAQTAPSFLQ